MFFSPPPGVQVGPVPFVGTTCKLLKPWCCCLFVCLIDCLIAWIVLFFAPCRLFFLSPPSATGPAPLQREEGEGEGRREGTLRQRGGQQV